MKKLFLNFVMAAALCAPVVLTSCEKDDDNGGNGVGNQGELWEGTTLVGDVNTQKRLDASKTYTLAGNLIINEGGELTIPAGTRIEANAGFEQYILVSQGGKININGTFEKPVTITAKTAGENWGGLIICGRAPLAGGEISTAEINDMYDFGGTNPADNSGKITYLKLEYTGEKNNSEVEHNGLTLNGVGSGTVINNVYISDGMDDGIEFFGGTVSVKNIFVKNSDDDCFDATQGWSGTLENAYGLWAAGFSSGEKDPSGVEIDGNYDGLDATQAGQTDCRIINLTIENNGGDMSNVMMIRRRAKVTIENALVKGNGPVQYQGTAGYIVNVLGKNNASEVANNTSSIKVSVQDAMTGVAFTNGGASFDGSSYAGVESVSGNTGCTADFGWINN